MDGVCESFGCSDEYAYFLGTGNSCVYQVALEHDVMVHCNRHDHYWELRALALVDSDGVCECDLIKFTHIIFYRFVVKHDGGSTFIGIDG